MAKKTLVSVAVLAALAVSAAFIICRDSDKPEFYSVLDRTESLAGYMASRGVGGEMVPRLLGHTPEYRRLIGKSFGQATKYRIYIISTVHAGLDSADPDNPMVKMSVISSGLVRDFLLKTEPDVVANEQDFAGKVTRQTRLNDERSLLNLLQLPDDGIEQHQDEPALLDGTLLYLDRRPKAFVTGAEDLMLCAFDVGLGVSEAVGYYDPGSEWGRLHELTISLRSHIALAKLILKLKETGGKTGAVVMGGRHKQDFQELEAVLGSKFVFYDAVPEDGH